MQVFIFGGSGSGKSTLAESLAIHLSPLGKKTYLATMWPAGKEAKQRIARHRAMRQDKGFTTMERYFNLAQLQLPPGGTVLLECLGNWVANEMFAPGATGSDVEQALLGGMAALRQQSAHLVIVSNDVGADGTRYPYQTRRFQQTLAAANRRLLRESDVAIEMVCGIPIFLKGENRCPSLRR